MQSDVNSIALAMVSIEIKSVTVHTFGNFFCFGSLVVLDVARCYLWLFTLYINIKIGKIVFKC